MKHEELIKLAKDRCNNNSYGNRFYNIYPFTTENISGYIDYFDLFNHTLLTVGSSVDQMLNAILYDIKKATIIDINPFTEYYFYLKVASILELDIEEFLLFLRYNDYPELYKSNKMIYNKLIYNKIKDTLYNIDNNAYCFWNELFNTYNNDIIHQRLFSKDEGNNTRILGSNPYLQSDNSYKLLKKKLSKIDINFIVGSILTTNINNTYDNIWLSNIPMYFNNYNEIDITISKYYNKLNKNGKLLYTYLYEYKGIKDTYMNNYPHAYDIGYFLKKSLWYHPNIITFDGINTFIDKESKAKDAILVLKK